MRLMALLFFMALGVEVMAGNTASIVLNRGDAGEDQRSFVLFYEYAFVAQGSYSGIRTEFRTREQDNEYHKLTLFIPAHDEFKIGYMSRRGDYMLQTPDVPFTLRAGQTKEIKDRFDRPRSLNLELSHWRKVGKGHWSQESVSFSDCDIHVESMYIKEGKLAFSGSFECGTDKSEGYASGEFSINDGELGVSKVD